MADKQISQLTEATSIGNSDLFVLQQSNEAKKLTGETLVQYVGDVVESKGYIASIALDTTTPHPTTLQDRYKITFSISGTSPVYFDITNGKGLASTSAVTPYYGLSTDASVQPTSWSTTVPTLTATNKYLWCKITLTYNDETTTTTTPVIMGVYGDKGDTGATGAAATLSSSEVKYQASSDGSTVPTGTWLDTPPSVSYPNYLWTRNTLTFNTGNPVVFYSVAKAGQDGQGTAGSATPQMDGTASAGSDSAYSRQDHVHPSDTSKQDVKLSFSNTPVSTSAWATQGASAVCSTSGATASVNYDTFVGELSTAGTYVFTYDGTDWNYDSTAITLADYGITFTDSGSALASGDTITVTLVIKEYADFPCKATIALANVTASMFPEVVLSPADALSGSFAPIATSYAGGIYMYASSVPSAAITIPTIICWG